MSKPAFTPSTFLSVNWDAVRTALRQRRWYPGERPEPKKDGGSRPKGNGHIEAASMGTTPADMFQTCTSLWTSLSPSVEKPRLLSSSQILMSLIVERIAVLVFDAGDLAVLEIVDRNFRTAENLSGRQRISGFGGFVRGICLDFDGCVVDIFQVDRVSFLHHLGFGAHDILLAYRDIVAVVVLRDFKGLLMSLVLVVRPDLDAFFREPLGVVVLPAVMDTECYIVEMFHDKIRLGTPFRGGLSETFTEGDAVHSRIVMTESDFGLIIDIDNSMGNFTLSTIVDIHVSLLTKDYDDCRRTLYNSRYSCQFIDSLVEWRSACWALQQ